MAIARHRPDSLAVSAFIFLALAVAHAELAAAIPGLLIVALIFFGLRAPALVGVLLIAFAPIGFVLALVGSTNLDPASQVLLGVVWWAGIPLVAGILLIAAARSRS